MKIAATTRYPFHVAMEEKPKYVMEQYKAKYTDMKLILVMCTPMKPGWKWSTRNTFEPEITPLKYMVRLKYMARCFK